jgi:hypothetical protein
MREYYWLHYVICSVIPVYGFLAVLAKKKKCRGCARPFEPLRKDVVNSAAST